MGIEPKKIVKLICTNQNQYDILTEMPIKEIVAEVEYEHLRYEASDMSMREKSERDAKWCRLEGLTPSDEKVPAAVIREDIRGYLIIPFHPSQNVQQVQPAERVIPRIMQ